MHTSSDLVDIGILKMAIAFQINQFVKVITLAISGYRPQGQYNVTFSSLKFKTNCKSLVIDLIFLYNWVFLENEVDILKSNSQIIY